MRDKTFLAAFTLLLFFSCGGSDDSPELLPEKEVYLLGREQGNQGDYGLVYFKDSIAAFVHFPGQRFIPAEVTVSENNEITVSGTRVDDNSNPVFWTAGQVFNPDLGGRSLGSVSGHFMNNNIVHPFGYVKNDNGDIQACYWVHQRLVLLESNFDYTEATGMAIVDGSIVVSGFAYVRSVGNIPVYWRDGVVKQLRVGSANNMGTTDLEVKGNDVYILGQGVNDNFEVVIGVWKNEELTEYLRPEPNLSTQDLEIVGDEGEVRFDFAYSDATNVLGYYAGTGDVVIESNLDNYFSVADLEFSGDDVYMFGTVSNGAVSKPIKLYINGIAQEREFVNRFTAIDLFIKAP